MQGESERNARKRERGQEGFSSGGNLRAPTRPTPATHRSRLLFRRRPPLLLQQADARATAAAAPDQLDAASREPLDDAATPAVAVPQPLRRRAPPDNAAAVPRTAAPLLAAADQLDAASLPTTSQHRLPPCLSPSTPSCDTTAAARPSRRLQPPLRRCGLDVLAAPPPTTLPTGYRLIPDASCCLRLYLNRANSTRPFAVGQRPPKPPPLSKAGKSSPIHHWTIVVHELPNLEANIRLRKERDIWKSISFLPMANSEAGTSRDAAPASGCMYQVFLSFRGPDTRHGFTDFLYNDLVDVGVVYLGMMMNFASAK
ncbi:hypothetical protein BT93_C1935 [Corymbia citriodora subsp. variegata]|nr:hypothetical protein BT93_C1935 [Corymbia citriodora subsp. variegata]